jgi:hypothetical protein
MANSPVSFRIFGDGELVILNDLNQDSDATRQLVGTALTLLLGAVNALPTAGSGYTPLSILPDTADLTLQIGGTGQAVYLTQRIVDNCPSQGLTVAPNNTGVTRYDLVSIQYAQPTTNPQTGRAIEDTSIPPNITSGTVYSVAESLNYAITTGTATGQPAGPVGYTPFALITVPAGAIAITQAEIQYLFPTMAQLFDAVVGALVSSVNGQAGAITLLPGSAIAVTPGTSPGQILISNVGVNTVNSLTGAVTIGPGGGIAVTPNGNSVVIANTGVLSLAGLTGNVILQSSSGILLTQPQAGVLQIDNSGVVTINGRAGALTIAAGSNITVVERPTGTFTITALGVPGSAGVQGPAGPAGGLGPQGPAGPAGPIGPQGPIGSVGSASTVPGIQGPAGPTGPRGLTGATGASGAASTVAGPTGPAGPNNGVGTTYMARVKIQGNSTIYAECPVALGTGSWSIWVYADCDLGGGSMTLTGISGATWDAPNTVNDQLGVEHVSLGGTAVGTLTPYVQLSFSGAPCNAYKGYLFMLISRQG